MTPEQIDELLLQHFARILGKDLKTVLDLGVLNSRQLLQLADQLEDIVLPSFVHMLKRSNGGENLFQKLMGDHEEENRVLVDSFFNRYMKMVMEPKIKDYNPLIVHIPAEYFNDIVFLETRKGYFCSQQIRYINEFLLFHFDQPPVFSLAQEEQAWQWFWSQVSKVDYFDSE